MRKCQDQHVIGLFHVKHRIWKTSAKVPPGLAAENPMNPGVRPNLPDQPVHLDCKASRQRPTLALVIPARRQQIGLGLGDEADRGSHAVTTTHVRHYSITGDALHFSAADFIETTLNFDRPKFVDFRVGADFRQPRLIPLGKLLAFAGREFFEGGFDFHHGAHAGDAAGETTDRKSASGATRDRAN